MTNYGSLCTRIHIHTDKALTRRFSMHRPPNKVIHHRELFRISISFALCVRTVFLRRLLLLLLLSFCLCRNKSTELFSFLFVENTLFGLIWFTSLIHPKKRTSNSQQMMNESTIVTCKCN